ncbi:MAG: ATP-binding protein [Polyangiales bacterium]
MTVSVESLAAQLLGLEDPVEIFSVTLRWLGGGVGASLGDDQTVVLARGEEPPRATRVRGRVEPSKLERLLEGPASIVELVESRVADREKPIGYLAVPGGDRARIEAIAPHVSRALAIALALRDARSGQRIAEVAAASMQSLVEGSPLPRVFVDENLRVTMVNESFASLVSRSLQECIGSSLRELGAPDAESLEALLRCALQGDKPASGIEVASEGTLLQRRVWLASTHAVELGGRCVGATVVLHECTTAAHEEWRGRLVADVHAALRVEGAESTVPGLLVPALADWVVLDVFEHGVMRHVAAAHRDPKRRELVFKLPTDLERRGRPRGVALALATSRPDFLETDDVTLMMASDPELAAVVRALGEGPQLVLPLVHQKALGALTLARIDGPPFTPLEVRAASEIADALAHAREQARAVENARNTLDLFEDFRDVIARELRDPLTAIIGRLYIAAPKGTNEHLDAVRTAVDRMRGSLDRLVAAPLPDAGRRVDATCEASEVVRDALAYQAQILARRTLTTHIEPLVVRADRERLTVAFSALLAHAAAEAPPGGLVVVRVEREGDAALFSVSDTGPGFVPEHARRAFDGLWLGDRQASGLTLARATIESLGGRAWIETSPGTGAAYCFTVALA